MGSHREKDNADLSVYRLWALVLAIGLLASTTSCSLSLGGDSSSQDEGGRIRVVASFYPLYEFARQVGGDRTKVSLLVPPGQEPHDYEPAPRDIEYIAKANLLVYNGAGFEPWIEKVLGSVASSQLVVVDASQSVELIAGADNQRGEGPFDPHFWLDPVAAKRVVLVIRDALISIDPDGSDQYSANALAYTDKLDALDVQYQEGLRSCKRREVITSHAAFGYLATRYNLTVLSITGLSPDAEPSAARMKELIEFARERGVTHIFFERLVSPKLAKAIAAEVGAKTVVFDPTEGLSKEDMAGGKDYISLMRDNLKSLKSALECS